MSSHQCGKPGPLTNHFIIDRHDTYMHPVVCALRCNKVQYIIWKWSIMLIHELSSGGRGRERERESDLVWLVLDDTYRRARIVWLPILMTNTEKQNKVVTVETKVAEIIFKSFCLFYFFTATLTSYNKITISNVIIMQKVSFIYQYRLRHVRTLYDSPSMEMLTIQVFYDHGIHLQRFPCSQNGYGSFIWSPVFSILTYTYTKIPPPLWNSDNHHSWNLSKLIFT